MSVVIPAYGEQAALDLTLAALAAQTYPAELLETVVVDDGSVPPLRLPELRPAGTRIIPNDSGEWGIASAVRTAITASSGAVILRLDSDVIPGPTHVEAHARWHERADYFTVVGKLAFVDAEAESFGPAEVRDAVAAADQLKLFGDAVVSDDWEIALVKRSGGVVEDAVRGFTVANGATISFTRAMYEACGGLDTSMRLGSDTELGYRLAQHGALFIADTEAEAWHLGLSQMKSRRNEGKRFRHPFLANRVPLLRHLRAQPGRDWEVPYVRVVVDAARARLEPIRATVNSALSGSVADVEVVLTGPWEGLSDERVAPLADPQLDLRLISETFRGERRVRFLDHPPERAAPVPFQLFLDPGVVLRWDGLEHLISYADEHRLGRVESSVPSRRGPLSVRLDRTAALARAGRLRGPGETAEEVLEELWGVARTEPDEWFEDLFSERPGRQRQIEALRALLARLEAAETKPPSLPRRLALRVRRAFGRAR
ncbi:glycosyltransferase family 2 protein [Glycomyces tarimensis]